MPSKVGSLVTLITSLVAICHGQQSGLNVYVVRDAGDTVAKEATEAAMGYLEENIGTKVAMAMVEVEEFEATAAVNTVCTKLDALIDAGTPPDLVLDLTKIGIASEMVKSISLTLALPTVSSSFGEEGDIAEWRDINNETEEYLIQVRPPGDLLPFIIRDLVLNNNITNVAIYHDTTFVMDHLYTSLLLNMPVRHIFTHIKTSNYELKEQLTRSVVDAEINNFFILGNSETLMSVFQTASELGMYGEEYNWFAATKDSDAEFDPSCCQNMTVVLLSPILPSSAMINSYKSTYGLTSTPQIEAGFYFDLAVRALSTVHKMKSEGSWPEMTYTKCSEYSGEHPIDRSLYLASNMKNVSITDAYGPIILESNGLSYMSFSLRVVAYIIKAGKLEEKKELGTWSAGVPGQLTLEAEKALKAKNVFRVVTVIQPPFMQWNELEKKFEGFCAEMIADLAMKMDFEYELYVAPGNIYGVMDKNEEWNGLIGELANRRADIGVGAISVMAERENVVDFSVPYYDLVGISLMIKRVKLPTSLYKFLTVMDNTVWSCIFGAFFITSVIMWIFDWYSPYSYQNNMVRFDDDEDKRYFNLKESLWFCCCSLTPQGGGEAPRTHSSRLVAGTWWMFAFILIASYTSNLAAFLTMEKLEEPVKSLKDLSRQFKIQYSPIEGSATAAYFERMAGIEEKFYWVWKRLVYDDVSLTDLQRSKLTIYEYPVGDLYTKIWEQMKKVGLPANFEEATERVRSTRRVTEGFAFLGDATDIRYKELTDCQFAMVGHEFSRKPYALAVPQNSPLKEQINDGILTQLNERKLERYKLNWWNWNPNKKKCEKELNSAGISIENIGGVFIAIFSGMFLAMVTLGVEYWYYMYKVPQSRVGSADSTYKRE